MSVAFLTATTATINAAVRMVQAYLFIAARMRVRIPANVHTQIGHREHLGEKSERSDAGLMFSLRA